MKNIYLILIMAFFAVALFDGLGSIASRTLNFHYSYLGIVSFAIYVMVAYFIARYASKKTTIMLLALLGLFDATVGWYISVILRANVGGFIISEEPLILILTIVTVMIYSSFLGLLGWWLAKKFGKKVGVEKPKTNE
ncbi:MAG: hypothetical protein EOO47_16320 [Flavobacterium sp.]|nr:MAG: hypothetical protein EOO47_16320 [Flavobacterium sp.]